jgi:ABC-type glycerol-3-phosphate transport system substrate-binding protein
MKKKLVTIIAIMLITSIFLFGCQGATTDPPTVNGGDSTTTEAPSDEQVTIEWWTPNWDEEESREMAAEFEAENSNIKVELVITDWDTYKSRITTAISAGDAPELSTVLTTDIAPFAKQGLLQDLDGLLADAGADVDDFLQASLDIASVDGKIYGVPFRHDGSGIFYNVDILSEAGYDEFPSTWADMVEMSKKLTQDGVYGFAWPLGQQANAVTRLVQQIYSHGGDVFNEDGTESLLNSPEAIASLRTIVSSIEEGYASPSSLEYDNTTMRAAFGSGQLAFNFTGPFDVDAIQEEYPELNFSTAVIPGIDGMGVTTSNGWSVIMAEKSNNKEAAAKFLAYITTPENQARLTDSFPASYTALEYDQFQTEYLAPFAEQLTNSKPEPTHDRWAEIEPIIFRYIQMAVSGETSVEEACEGMHKEINDLLSF